MSFGKREKRAIERFAGRLRFPYLFALTLLVFIADMLIPDPLPFVDEILLALLTLMFGMLRQKPELPEND